MQSRFIRVTKDNSSRDRGIIAIDAICSIFENRENHNVSIMTLDGFWYDVLDSLDELYKKVEDGLETTNAKIEKLGRMKMMPANSENDRPKQSHEDVVSGNNSSTTSKQIEKKTQTIFKERVKSQTKRKNSFRRFSRSLPAGAGEGQYELTPKVEKPQIGESL